MILGRKWREVLGVCGLFVVTFFLISLISYSPTDPPNSSTRMISNWGGQAGAYFSHYLFLYLGLISWLVPLLLAFFSVKMFEPDAELLRWRPICGWFLFAIGGCGILALTHASYGGLLGLYVLERFTPFLGIAGTFLVSLLLLVVGVMFQTELPLTQSIVRLRAVLTSAGHLIPNTVKPLKAMLKKPKEWWDDFRDRRRQPEINRAEPSPATAGATTSTKQNSSSSQSDSGTKPDHSGNTADQQDGEAPEASSSDPDRATRSKENVIPFDREDVGPPGEDSTEEPEEQAADQSEPIEVKKRRPTVDQADMSQYKLPPLNLLSGSDIDSHTPDDDTLNNMTKRLEATFEDFKIDAEVSAVSPGPVLTTYEVEPGPGVSVKKIESRLEDIKLNLAVKSVRIVSPIPGKSAIGIEVPNPNRALVKLRDVMDSEAFQNIDGNLPIALGMDVMGNCMATDLASMPHLLVAGTTGAGKSVCINTIICSFLYRLRPDQLKLIMVDPKRVELKLYEGLPHLMTPVIDDPSDANQAIQWAVDEMEDRYNLLQKHGCRDIDSYNEQNHDDPLPYVVIVVDELADLMMTSGKECEKAITRIAQKARAVGIHMVLATQRPDKDVITGLIKANMDGRIAFRVSDNVNSRVILDQKGAEMLLGNGDLLFLSKNHPNPIRAQGSFINDEETKNLIRFVKEQVRPSFIDEDEIYGTNEADGYLDNFEDEYYEDAKELVVQSGKASASMIQRRFSVGYNRAAKMVDAMEQEGIVGPHRGSKAREVMVDADEFFDET